MVFMARSDEATSLFRYVTKDPQTFCYGTCPPMLRMFLMTHIDVPISYLSLSILLQWIVDAETICLAAPPLFLPYSVFTLREARRAQVTPQLTYVSAIYLSYLSYLGRLNAHTYADRINLPT